MNPIHCHKKPRSGSPNHRGQQDIAPWDPRLESYGSDVKINQPQNIYIHHYYPHTITASHHYKKPGSYYPNLCGQRDIASQYPRCESSGSNSKIKDRCNSYGSEDNIHYRKGRFLRSHSSRKHQHRWSHDSRQPDKMNDEDMVEDG